MISLWVSLLMISIIWIFGSLISSSFVIKCNCSIWFFLMMVWLLFIIGYMGLFFYPKIGSIISIGDLPTTNIIEPNFLKNLFHNFIQYIDCFIFHVLRDVGIDRSSDFRVGMIKPCPWLFLAEFYFLIKYWTL